MLKLFIIVLYFYWKGSALENSIVDSAMKIAEEKASEDGKQPPKTCHHCKGKGETAGIYGGTKWECLHCDGTGYLGSGVSIAKWFKLALTKRTEKLLNLRRLIVKLQTENELLKNLYPDWQDKVNAEMEDRFVKNHHSRFD